MVSARVQVVRDEADHALPGALNDLADVGLGMRVRGATTGDAGRDRNCGCRDDESDGDGCRIHVASIPRNGIRRDTRRYPHGIRLLRTVLTNPHARAKNANVSVDVLGTLLIDTGPISPRERAVLAALVLRAPMPVAPGELADAVWGAAPPPTWPKQVQITIARLRSHDGTPIITTTPAGYRLDAAPDSIDAQRFERLLASGREHAARGEPDRADAALTTALGLWRGTPYSDLADWEPARREAGRLEDLRSTAEEQRLRARLEMGHGASLVGEAERLVRERPLRERRWEMLATALYRAGRQADALAALREARSQLADELGVDASPELLAVETAILRHDPTLEALPVRESFAAPCPYRGLEPYGEADEEEYFGRDVEVLAALKRIERTHFVAFAGQSGCGKSSLVLAGVVPSLRRQRRGIEITSPRHRLRSTAAELRARGVDVLVVDQFEELFTGGLASTEIDAQVATYADFVAGEGTLLLTVRSDFLDAAARLDRVGDLFTDGVQLVQPMDQAGLRAAIEEPAHLAGLRLEPGLTELILRDAAGRPGALPHVSHSLVETWRRQDGSTLTVQGYQESGGLAGAIAQSADRLYNQLSPRERLVCRSMLLRLVSLGADGSPVRRSLSTKSLHDDGTRDRVLALLEGARLVSADETSVIVAHEALADAWPRLRSWLEHDADELRTMHALQTAAETWDTGGRNDEDLYRGGRLVSALEWRDGDNRDLTAVEQAFLRASESREASDRRELADRVNRERRQNRRLRGILGVAGVLIVALVGAGAFAAISADQAQQGRTSATIEAMTSTSLALRGPDPEVAALLAAEAYRRWPDDPRPWAALLGVLTGARGFLGNSFAEGTEDFLGIPIPGTERAFVVELNGDAAVRDISTAAVVSEIELGLTDLGRPYPVLGASADGRIGAVLWSAASDPPGGTWFTHSVRSSLVAVDLASGERLLGPTLLDIGTGAIAVNEDGSTIAIADGLEGEVTLIDVASGRLTPVAGVHTGLVENETYAAALAFTRDGRLLAGHLGDRVDVIDPGSASVIGHVRVPEESAHVAMTVLPSGLVLASGDRAVVAFDPAHGTPSWTQPLVGSRPAGCEWIAGSELVGRFYCSGEYGGGIEYDLRTGEPTGVVLDGILGGTPIAVAADGSELVAISSRKHSISRWRLDGSGLVTRRIAPPGSGLAGGFSQDGHAVLTAGGHEGPVGSQVDVAVAVRDATTGDVMMSFGERMVDSAWAGSDAFVAYFPDEGALRLVDASTGEHVGPRLPGDSTFGWVTHQGTRLYLPIGDDRIVRVDTSSGRIEGEPITMATDHRPIALSASPDGEQLAITTWDPKFAVHLWIVDETTGEVLRSGRLENGLAFHALLDDGSLIAAGDNRIARVDTTTFTQSGSLPGTAGGLGPPQLSGDERVVLITAADGTIMLYDVATGTRLADSFRPDGGSHRGASLRPDGLALAVSDESGVFIWDLDPAHHFEAVCRVAGRDLTPDEWRSYLPEFSEPRSTCDLD